MLEMPQTTMAEREGLQRDDQGSTVASASERATIDIGRLDAIVQEELAAYCSINGFSFALWRDKTEPGGCNWNARLQPLQKCAAVDNAWWDVIPRLRERYNLTPLRRADDSRKIPKAGG